MEAMYRGVPFSPQTALSSAVGAADAVLPVEDVSAFPPAPSYATIGTDEGAETVLYTALTENALSGCTRGVEGTAKAWAAGETVARNFTAADHGALVGNINAVNGTLAVHIKNAAIHVSQKEKDGWDAKESPEGAQAKADAAEAAAKAASRPAGWTPTAAEVGAAASSHTHTAADISALPGTDYAASRVRGISAGTTDLTAGTSNLESGTIYLVYE